MMKRSASYCNFIDAHRGYYERNMLLKHFLDTPKRERESAGFRLPAMVPIVSYNGPESWTAVKSLREYQNCGDQFGIHILNLKYYLIYQRMESLLFPFPRPVYPAREIKQLFSSYDTFL